jgi:hypothetical protein
MWYSACGGQCDGSFLVNVGENYRKKLKEKPDDTFKVITNNELVHGWC